MLILLATLLPVDVGVSRDGAFPAVLSWSAAWADRDDDDRGGRDDDRSPRDDTTAPRESIGSPRESIGSPRDDFRAPREDIGSPRDDRMGGAERFEGSPAWLAARDFAADELVAFGLSAATLATLQQGGFVVIQQRRLPELDRIAVRLRVPRGTSLQRAAQQVRALEQTALVDQNHFYRLNQVVCQGRHCTAVELIKWPIGAQRCDGKVTIGLIDTGVHGEHEALREQDVETIVMRGVDRQPSTQAHGTAVSSLLVGAPQSVAPGLLPQARLVAVDAFHRAGRSEDRMDAFDLVGAIDALLGRKVRVMNMSFAGPPNSLLEYSVKVAQQRGVVLVAAAGNEGPRAAPRYPAAYADVVAVTAVRADLEVYRRAGRGEHIKFAAPGVDVWAAHASGRGQGEAKANTGTSFAAPFVTAAVALQLVHAPRRDAASLKKALIASARDLGAPGFDPVFGHGLLQAGELCAGLRKVTR